MRLLAGTSGYSFKEWKGSFYPEDIKADGMLSFYATKFPTIEINNTFYRLPKENVLREWASQVPPEFTFALKASQRITHHTRLKAESQSLVEFLLKNTALLEDRLGPILFQLPPNMKKDLPRLETFLAQLPSSVPAAFEFRHPEWFDDDVLELLRSQNRPLVVSDTDDLPTTHIDKTADWGYLRLRRVNYSEENLVDWAERIRKQNWKETFLFFKHEDEGTGPKLAAQFLSLANAG